MALKAKALIDAKHINNSYSSFMLECNSTENLFSRHPVEFVIIIIITLSPSRRDEWRTVATTTHVDRKNQRIHETNAPSPG